MSSSSSSIQHRRCCKSVITIFYFCCFRCVIMPLTSVMNYVFAYIYLSLNCKQQLQFAAPHQPATVATYRYIRLDSLTKCPKNWQILQKLPCLLLSISSGQLVLWREQLVLEDTKKGLLRPCHLVVRSCVCPYWASSVELQDIFAGGWTHRHAQASLYGHRCHRAACLWLTYDVEPEEQC